MTGRPTRRAFLAGAAAGAAGLAGCGGLVSRRGGGEPPLVADRPDGVYVPSHVEGMEMIGMPAAVGPYGVALSFTFPHRFWLVRGTDATRVTPADDADVHLMATVWDRETGVVLPTPAPRVTVRRDGETVAARALWPMLSQPMGTHFGDNVPLAGDGGYELTVTLGPPTTPRLTGPAFPREPTSFTAGFQFSTSRLETVGVRQLEGRRGQRGAVDVMEMDALPSLRAPAAASLPGTDRGAASAGDARFLARALAPERAGTDDPYLAVSARTAYNRLPLPELQLSVRAGDGDPVDLRPAVDPDLGYHYGAAVPGAGDASLSLRVETPPQVTRHEGYETAFRTRSTVRVG
jgi:hypothetical protein